MLVINLFAGPGCGKSTTATGVFSLLKLHGINAEYVSEFAKDLVWEERHKTLSDQYYIWGKQYHRMWRLRDDVDVIVTDSPLLLSILYGENVCDSFCKTVLETFNSTFVNLNYFLGRIKPYNPKGRVQTEEEAKEIDRKTELMLLQHDVDYKTITGNIDGINEIVQDVLGIFNKDVQYSIIDNWDF